MVNDLKDAYVVGIHCANCKRNGWAQVPKSEMKQAVADKECPNCGIKGYVRVR